MNEGKKGFKNIKHTSKPTGTAPKPRNFVAKNAVQSGAGAHKDKKKAAKQGDAKHKKLEIAESATYDTRLDLLLQIDLTESAISEISRGDYYSKAQKSKMAAIGKTMFADPNDPEVQKAQRTIKNRNTGMARSGQRGRAELAARQDQQRQQSAAADKANLPALAQQFQDMLAKFKQLGGTSYQYADRMTDRDREAEQLHGQLNALKKRIDAAGSSQGVAEGVLDTIKQIPQKANAWLDSPIKGVKGSHAGHAINGAMAGMAHGHAVGHAMADAGVAEEGDIEQQHGDTKPWAYWGYPERVAKKLYQIYQGNPISKAEIVKLWKEDGPDRMTKFMLKPDVAAILSNYEQMSDQGPLFKEGSDERNQNALWAQITAHEKAAKKSKDLKQQHHLKMADQLRSQLKTNNMDEGFDYTMKDLGNDYAGFPSNHSLKHKMLKRISPEHHQLYKDKMNNTHDSNQLMKLFHVAKSRGHVIDDQGVAETSNEKISNYLDKADMDIVKKYRVRGPQAAAGDKGAVAKTDKTINKRMAGIDRANARLNK